MEPVPSLRELFAALSDGSSDPGSALAAAGHGSLPPDLVHEAISSYADTAPLEVAEHLAPFVVADSAVPPLDAAQAAEVPDGLTLLASYDDDGFTDVTTTDTDADHAFEGGHAVDPGHTLDAHGTDPGHTLDGAHPAADPGHTLDHHITQAHAAPTAHDPAPAEEAPRFATGEAGDAGTSAAGDLHFGHGQAAALASTDEPDVEHYDSPSWLSTTPAVHDDPVAALDGAHHDPTTATEGWHAPDADGSVAHPAPDVEQPAVDDHPLDPGHA